MVLIAMMAAVTCILGPLSLSIPVSPVPISLTNLAVYFTVYVLGMKLGTVSYLIYMLLGLVGLPVFPDSPKTRQSCSDLSAVTYIGFIFMVVICGYFIEQWSGKLYMHFIGMVLGTAVCYLFGTVWLAYQANMGFYAALGAGIIPFIPGDLARLSLPSLQGQ